jgi:hypothetical protein
MQELHLHYFGLGANNLVVWPTDLATYQHISVASEMVEELLDKERKTFFDGLVLYFWWNIWKERNRRTFQQTAKSPTEVAYLIKDDVNLIQPARNHGAPPSD